MSKAISVGMPWPAVSVRRAGLPAPGPLFRQWVQRSRQRRQLAALTPEQLRDIGITSEAAQREAAKPFWQA
jgi:uncharacterized protein YjiS (DUF1127 family)